MASHLHSAVGEILLYQDSKLTSCATGPALGGQAAHEGRGAAHCQQYRQAARATEKQMTRPRAPRAVGDPRSRISTRTARRPPTRLAAYICLLRRLTLLVLLLLKVLKVAAVRITRQLAQ